MYIEEEMVMLSIIFSDYTVEQYPREKVDHELLFEIFRLSLQYEESIFIKESREKLLVEALESLEKKNPRKDYMKRYEQLKRYFSNFDYEYFFKRAQYEIALAERDGIKIITYENPKYPSHLKNIALPPFVLYIKGLFPSDYEFNHSLAIIGSRKIDEKYGKKIALELGELLLNSAWYNISGLALGCDEYGHRGSMGATGAILGQGLSTPVFPKENIQLAQDILDSDGFLLSELPPSTPPSAHFLILRDRLQSGLTKGVIVVETSINGGTLYTVRYALDQRKEVFVMDLKGIEGNTALLNSEISMGNINIPKKERKKIIGLKKVEELSGYLDDLGKKSFSEQFSEKGELVQKTLL